MNPSGLAIVSCASLAEVGLQLGDKSHLPMHSFPTTHMPKFAEPKGAPSDPPIRQQGRSVRSKSSAKEVVGPAASAVSPSLWQVGKGELCRQCRLVHQISSFSVGLQFCTTRHHTCLTVCLMLKQFDAIEDRSSSFCCCSALNQASVWSCLPQWTILLHPSRACQPARTLRQEWWRTALRQ